MMPLISWYITDILKAYYVRLNDIFEKQNGLIATIPLTMASVHSVRCIRSLTAAVTGLENDVVAMTIRQTTSTPCLKTTVQFCFCQNFVKFP